MKGISDEQGDCAVGLGVEVAFDKTLERIQEMRHHIFRNCLCF